MLLSLDNFTPFVDGLDHPEGVAWGPDGYLYAGGEAGQIYRISLDGRSVTEIASTGGFILGLCLDAVGNVYACDQGQRAVMRVTPKGDISSYSTGTPKRPFALPNYPVFDREGNLYVSDSGGWHRHNGCLFRIRPGGETAVVSTELCQFPNGLALAPDGQTLYVVLSNTATITKVALHPDGTLGAADLVVELPKTVPDGLAFDGEGNLYIACYTPDVIYRLTLAGDLDVVVEDWESTTIATPTNIAFAGADRTTLVIATLSRWHLTKVRMPIPGQPLYYPNIDTA